MVPVTGSDTDAAGLVAGHLADQMAALEHRIASANRTGSLDGLFAYHVLATSPIPLAWEVSPLAGRWLDGHAGQLTHAPQLAVLGYGLAHFDTAGAGTARTRLVAGLTHLMRRDPYPADGVTFLNDPRQLLGIALAAGVVRDQLPQVRQWLRDVLDNDRAPVGGPRLDLIRRHVRGMLTAEASVLTDLAGSHDAIVLALAHWVTVAGTARLPGPATDLGWVQRRILTGLLSTRVAELSVPDAALLRAAAGHIIDASIDSAVLNRSHVGVVLRRFTPAMRRWRWDDPDKVKDPIRWPINSEREVQDIVWLLLRGAFDDLVDEEPLRKFGHSSYRSDFGLPRLGVLVEIKYVRSATEFKKVEKEVIEDSVAYLKERATYQKIVVFIYDASASPQEHDITAAALLDLEHVIDVVIVPRPGHLPAPGGEATGTATSDTKRSRVKGRTAAAKR